MDPTKNKCDRCLDQSRVCLFGPFNAQGEFLLKLGKAIVVLALWNGEGFVFNPDLPPTDVTLVAQHIVDHGVPDMAYCDAAACLAAATHFYGAHHASRVIWPTTVRFPEGYALPRVLDGAAGDAPAPVAGPSTSRRQSGVQPQVAGQSAVVVAPGGPLCLNVRRLHYNGFVLGALANIQRAVELMREEVEETGEPFGRHFVPDGELGGVPRQAAVAMSEVSSAVAGAGDVWAQLRGLASNLPVPVASQSEREAAEGASDDAPLPRAADPPL